MVAILIQKLQTFSVVHGPREQEQARETFSSFHLQTAQRLEEETTEAIMVLKGNSNVLASLRNFYQDLQQNDTFTLKDTCGQDLAVFTTQVGSFTQDSNMQIERGRLLADTVAGRKTVVSADEKMLSQLDRAHFWVVDTSAPPKSGNGEDGEANDQYAKRFNHCEDHCFPHIFVSACYICLSESLHRKGIAQH